MKDTFDYCTTPSNEPCAQTCEDNYRKKAYLETEALIGQIRRQFGNEPEGVRLYRQYNPHDFGTYLTLAAEFDSEDKNAIDWVFGVDNKFPELWDDKAKQFLELNGYKLDNTLAI